MKNTNRTNPLDQIEFWLTSLSLEQQEAIIRTAHHYHIDEAIANANIDNQYKTFFNYFDSSELNERQIVSRAFFVIKLMEVVFTGKETEKDWEIVLNRFITLRNLEKEKGFDTTLIEDAINGHEANKKMWFNLIDSWNELIEKELTNKQIIDWYFKPALSIK